MPSTPNATLGLRWARIASLEKLEGGHLLLGLETPGVEPKPGQYALLADGGAFLPRPFSYFGFEGGVALFLIKIRGKFTHWLAERRPGERLLWRGPHGKPLPRLQNPLLVAGGVGVAPLGFYRRAYGGKLLLGLPTLWSRFVEVAGPDELATEDGSGGTRGTVLELLKGREGLAVACGPTPMLKALAEVWPEEKLILVLEGMMACGVGTCLGCAVPKRGGGYLRLCKEGPWFWARELDLGRLST